MASSVLGARESKALGFRQLTRRFSPFLDVA
jgi:hypothetical protein